MGRKKKLLTLNFMCLLMLAIIISFSMLFSSYSFGETISKTNDSSLAQEISENGSSSCGIEYSSAEVPVYEKNGYQIFCIEKGGTIRGPSSISVGDVAGGRYHSPARVPSEDQKDTPTYRCVGEGDLNLTAAYSLSAQRGHWTSTNWSSDHISDTDWGILQDALWADDINVMSSGKEEFKNSISGTTGYALWQEALRYQNFYNQMQARGGFNAKDVTSKKDVNKIVNQEDKNYIVGPFKIDYLKEIVDSVDGTRVNYGAITKISIIDQDNNEMENVQIIKDSTDENYNFPNPNQEFYVKFNADEYPNARRIKVKVDFEYLENCTGRYHKIEGYGDEIGYRLHSKRVKTHCYRIRTRTDSEGHKHRTRKYYRCTYYYYKAQVVGQYRAQNLMAVHLEDKGDLYTAKRVINHETLYLENENNDFYDLTMNIGGYVFLDNTTGKAGVANGLKDENDKPLQNVIVTLYDQDGNLATLYNDDVNNIRTNPTITDENGYYEFGKLNSMKKYFVKFTYNGELHTSTAYLNNQYNSVSDMVNAGQYNTDLWAQVSKGKENDVARQEFNNQFAEIGSYPNSYRSTNSLNYGLEMNSVYKYQDLLDVYNAINTYIKDYISQNKQWPDLKETVYPYIISNSQDNEIKNKLQFIEDCKIDAFTGVNGNDNIYYTYTGINQGKVNVSDKLDLYPVYNKFVISDQKATIDSKFTSDQGTYPPIYPGQLQVNYGVIYRPTFDLALYKDVYNATIKINGKSETYYYDKRAALGKTFRFGVPIENGGELTNEQLEEKHLNSITNNVKVDYKESVTRDSYAQYIRREDINQSGNGNTETAVYDLSDEDKLDVYIKYKVAIKNQASTIGAVTELVDYFDSNFVVNDVYLGDVKGNNIGGQIATSNASKYGAEISPMDGYSAVYLEIPDSSLVRLADGETMYVYITLRMNNASTLLEEQGLLNGDTYDTYNYVEINGYKSYNDKNSNITPGLIDIDSTAGNFDIKTYKPGETLLEDDEDTAPAVIFTIYEKRELEGNVFEDKVESVDSNNESDVYTGKYRVGDGKYTNDDTPVAGVRVELVEIKNGNMEVRAYTYTDENGYYRFDSYIPGEYVVRYVYGEEDKTALTINNKNYTGLNAKSYNGQDFQSTIAKNRGEENESYNDLSFGTTTVVNNYGDYPYYWFGEDSERNSDATDISKRRDEVNKYSLIMKNHISEVLNSYKDSQVNRELVDELEKNTFMIALTPEFSVEPEYMKQELLYDGVEQNQENYTYKIQNVDFGIVERARAFLSAKKVVDKVNLTAADGTVLANGYIDNNKVVITDGAMKWVSNLIQLNNKGIVSIEADQELLHGAKLIVSYKIILTNNSEYDTYKGNIVTGKVNRLIDYIDNNFTFDTSLNKGWSLVKSSDLQLDDGTKAWVNGSINLKDESRKAIDLSTYQNIVVTNNDNEIYNKELKPGESVETNIVLQKIISTTEDDTDDYVYLNDIEIIESSMSNGRKDYYDEVGNYDPVDKLSKQGDRTWDDGLERDPEPDTSQSEKVIITPPTGGKFSNAIYYLIGAIAIIVVGVIIIFVNKKIKKNKNKK